MGKKSTCKAAVVCSLLLLLIVVSVESHKLDTLNSKIDRLISKRWESYKQRNHIAVETTYDEKDHEHHLCEHNFHMRQPELTNTLQKSLREPSNETIIQATTSHAKRVDGRESIRINVDDTRIRSGDTGYTCRAAGNIITTNAGSQYTCTSDDVVNNAVISFLTEDVLPSVVDILQAVLEVDRLATFLLPASATGNCAVGLPIPERLRTTGVANTDYYIMATARTPSNTGTLATAGPCYVRANAGSCDHGRPLVGVVHFNPRYFSERPSNAFAYRRLVRVGLHEFTHALGFSPSMYTSYLNAETCTAWPDPVDMSGGIAVLMKTPRVTEFARSHFNCSSLNGFRLETDGGTGTASSHWEQADANEEYMVGTDAPPAYMSPLTLALFEDMGWYNARYEMAEDFVWGNNLGCEFVNTPCTSNAWPYSCSGATTGFEPGRAGLGMCQQGPSTMPGCNFIRGDHYCADTSNVQNPNVGDFYSPQSFAFRTQGIFNTGGIPAACYQVNCSDDRSTLSIQVDGHWKTCRHGGDTVSARILLVPVTVTCPDDISDICGLRQVSPDKVTRYKGGGYKWLLTNNGLLFWGTVILIIIAVLCIGCMILSCLCKCVRKILCCCCP